MLIDRTQCAEQYLRKRALMSGHLQPALNRLVISIYANTPESKDYSSWLGMADDFCARTENSIRDLYARV